MGYEFLEHTADVKFRAMGESWAELFTFAAEALNETIRGDIKILENEERIFEVEGPDMEVLLHNFLEEFLFLLDAKDFLVSRMEIVEFDEEGTKIKVKVFGDSADHYKFTNDVKAITFSEMYILKKGDIFECQVVLDV